MKGRKKNKINTNQNTSVTQNRTDDIYGNPTDESSVDNNDPNMKGIFQADASNFATNATDNTKSEI